MPIDRETQKALLRKVIDKLQEGQDNDVKNSNHIADEVVTVNQLVADRVDYLRQTITGERKKQEKDGKKGKGDVTEDARENRNLLSKIGNGISGLAQSTKDTAKSPPLVVQFRVVKVYSNLWVKCSRVVLSVVVLYLLVLVYRVVLECSLILSMTWMPMQSKKK